MPELRELVENFVADQQAKGRNVKLREPSADEIRERRIRQNAMNRAMLDDIRQSAEDHLTRYNWERI